jgi:hypothetical protein
VCVFSGVAQSLVFQRLCGFICRVGGWACTPRAAPFAKYQGKVTYFIHGNHLGSTTMVYNHTGGTVVQDEIFYPWGERWDGPRG